MRPGQLDGLGAHQAAQLGDQAALCIGAGQHDSQAACRELVGDRSEALERPTARRQLRPGVNADKGVVRRELGHGLRQTLTIDRGDGKVELPALTRQPEVIGQPQQAFDLVTRARPFGVQRRLG